MVGEQSEIGQDEKTRETTQGQTKLIKLSRSTASSRVKEVMQEEGKRSKQKVEQQL